MPRERPPCQRRRNADLCDVQGSEVCPLVVVRPVTHTTLVSRCYMQEQQPVDWSPTTGVLPTSSTPAVSSAMSDACLEEAFVQWAHVHGLDCTRCLFAVVPGSIQPEQARSCHPSPPPPPSPGPPVPPCPPLPFLVPTVLAPTSAGCCAWWTTYFPRPFRQPSLPASAAAMHSTTTASTARPAGSCPCVPPSAYPPRPQGQSCTRLLGRRLRWWCCCWWHGSFSGSVLTDSHVKASSTQQS
jgi:hypothetical protein